MLSDSLKVFITVAEKKNFSKAAKELDLTQPAISFQIQTLEQYYQTMLFDRVNRHIKLTEAGELLLEYAVSMNDLQSELERKMQQLTGHVKGELVIGASRTIGEYVLPYIVTGFTEAYPDVDITLEIHNTAQVEHSVQSRSIDLGLVESNIDDESLLFQQFLEDELFLCVASNHPWAKYDEVPLKELEKAPFIIREPGSGSRLVFEEALLKANYDVERLNVVMEIGNITAIKSVVSEGLGVSVMSRWAITDLEKRGKVKALPIESLSLKRPFTILLNHDNFESEACSKFIRYLGEVHPSSILEQL